jgi:soluble lytic murein transglycosylase-like protein
LAISRATLFGAVLLFGASLFAADAPKRTAYDATLRNGFTIHHLRHEVIGSNTRLYTDDKSYLDVPTSDIVDMAESQETTALAPELNPARSEPKAAPDVDQLVNQASDKHQIDADLISSVIRAESGFNPKARSPKGAQGLMQLMPGTASKLGVTDAYDPAANVDGGVQYLRELLLKYDGDIAKALAAYNAGPHRVEQYHGVPPYRETRTYVAKIIKDFNRKKLAAQKAGAAGNSHSQGSATSAKGR